MGLGRDVCVSVLKLVSIKRWTGPKTGNIHSSYGIVEYLPYLRGQKGTRVIMDIEVLRVDGSISRLSWSV